MENLYVVLHYHRWEDLETNLGSPIEKHEQEGCVGFLPVFDSFTDAEVYASEVGESDILAIGPRRDSDVGGI